MSCRLSDIATYVNERVSISKLTLKTYVSTENMIPNKGGITVSSGLPAISTTQAFKQGDVLVSNIRPYFKKIWVAEYDGGCSNDVLVFRPKEGIVSSEFLYLVLSDDAFFAYMMAGSKGTKMPRGDRKAIIDYPISDFAISHQDQITRILLPLNRKIHVNAKLNDNLQEQAFLHFNKLLQGKEADTCLSDYVCLNPNRQLPKGKIARCIDMSKLSTSGTFPSGWEYKEYNGGMKFCNGDTILARITPCLENGKTALINFLDSNEVAFGSTEYIVLSPKFSHVSPGFVYCLSRYTSFVDYAVKNMNGSSGRQRVSAETISQFSLPVISEKEFETFGKMTNPLFQLMLCNSIESLRLARMRDELLPRLLRGDIEIN